ncbi:RNA-binding protein [Perkinsela sp. CCAP 1560/4]|nr:RNA-binding protein [Perkinsela sp. CCAP 1560/4]|eukprot:KNH08389.1 RNA-binding protein [Perkinsela sp. CCAP 1560/4]
MELDKTPYAALFVSNLHPHAIHSTISQIFSAYGEVISVDTYPELPQSAIVKYASTSEADVAVVSLHGRYMMTTLPLVVIYDKSSQQISEFGRNHTMRVKFSLASSQPYASSIHLGSTSNPAREIQNEKSINLRSHDMVSYRLKTHDASHRAINHPSDQTGPISSMKD